MKQIFAFTLVLVSTYSYSQLEKAYGRPEYSINYPQKWTMDTSMRVAAAIFFYSPLETEKDNFSENVNIMTQNLAGQNINLASYKTITEKQISTMAVNGKLIKSTIEKTSRGDRYSFEYQMTMNSNNLHIKSLCYIKKDIAYLVTFTTKVDTFDKYSKTGSEILEAFRLK